MPDLDTEVLSIAPVAAEPALPPTRGRWSRWLEHPAFAVATLIAGVVVIYVALVALASEAAWIRVVLVLVGLVLLFFMLDSFNAIFFRRKFETSLLLSCFWLVALVLAAIFESVLPISEAEDTAKTINTPSLLNPDIFSAHPLGTDTQGLDILGGLILGARVSLTVGLGAVVLGTLVGGALGIVAGYYRGKVDVIIGLLSDVLLAFPPLIFLLALATVLKPSVQNVTFALALIVVPTYIRLARAHTLRLTEREFILAARGLGETNRQIVLRHLVPNLALPILSFGFIIFGTLIVAEASLSFLGLGIQRPQPTWGNMISAGQKLFEQHPNLVFAPGIMLFITVFSLSRVGDKLRKMWA